ncbi:hypothetical protein [Thermus sp.]|uniref:hypothetical protein n=1 Tax=Thermus sp. TaxID=275 RepID=UPI0025FE93E1|nr:hypothetical protein [Thermus sp.]MCS6867201.1 hypothetical protein [Thermus sp.]
MKHLKLLAYLGSLLLLLAACNQPQGGQQQERGFTLSLNPTGLTVQQGQSGTTTLTLTPQGGFTGAVALSLVGAPTGVTLSPTGLQVTGSSPVTQALALAVAESVDPGAYSLKVRATSGNISREADLSLTVAQDLGFTLETEVSSLTLAQGGEVSVLVRIRPVGNYGGPLTLRLVNGQDEPFPGVELSFTVPPRVNPSGPLETGMTLRGRTRNPVPPVGSHSLYLEGVANPGGPNERRSRVSLGLTVRKGFEIGPFSSPLYLPINGVATAILPLRVHGGWIPESGIAYQLADPPPGLSLERVDRYGSGEVDLGIASTLSLQEGRYTLRVVATYEDLREETTLQVRAGGLLWLPAASEIIDISGDGRTVLLGAYDRGGRVWTREGGLQDLPDRFPSPDPTRFGSAEFSVAHWALSPDGRYTTGRGSNGTTSLGFVYDRQTGQMRWLYELHTLLDGSVAVRRMVFSYEVRGEWAVGETVCGPVVTCPSAYRLPAGPLVPLMEGSSWPGGFANRIALAAPKATGRIRNAVGVLWDLESGSMEYLGSLCQDPDRETRPLDLSADGAVVVGYSCGRPFYWRAGQGIQAIGPEGSWGEAKVVSADGGRVFGRIATDGNTRVYEWSPGGGFTWLEERYAPLLSGSARTGARLQDIHAVTPDGRFVLGSGDPRIYGPGRTGHFILDTTWGP